MMQEFKYTPQVYIFGAHSRAKTLKGYLQLLYPEIKILSFLVDEIDGNELSIDGIPVQLLNSIEQIDCSCNVFIATKGIYHAAIQDRLLKKGVYRIIPVTVEIDNFLRNAYVRKYYSQEHMKFKKISDLYDNQLQVAIYMAKSIYDKPLQTAYQCPDYEKMIQAGAALTKQRLMPDIFVDCEGENISLKNRQYCELTVLYWIWKNAKEDIVGLSHYRRHFILPDKWQNIMISNKVDVILPVPTFVYPSIEENYKDRHDSMDWDYLMKYLLENYLEDYKVAKQVFSSNLYLPCNMFIMKKEILNDLCKWMFPVLDAVVKYCGDKEDSYQNRYPGFISERLITLYFHKYNNKYKIVFADKNFIQ